MQVNIALNNNFSQASHGEVKNDIFSSLRADAERFISDIQASPTGTDSSANSLLDKAFRGAVQSAKAEGRPVRRGDVLAHMYDERDRGIQGWHI